MTPADPTRTHPPAPADEPTGPFDPALDAGLAAAFDPDATPGGWSQPPLLRDEPSDDAPVVQPSSPEMPRGTDARYQLLGEIARGGMGVILKGRDPDLGRDLAFKVLKAELAGRPAAEQRFVEEAQVGGQLQHPGVVPVYDLGRFADGRPFFAMKLVKGRTLADLLTERPDPAADRGRSLHVFLQVCQTVAYAHSRGVIHRDLKPANVMVGSFGEVLVMDWGLAKVLPRGGVADEDRATQAARERPRPEPREEPTVIHTARSGSGSETAAGSVMGTPAYMSPEQAGGETDKLDERADVFGLGAVLCVVLTGRPPYPAASAEATRLMAIRGELGDAFARLDGCGADAELIALCKRCLAADRDARPRHAGEVVGAVSAHLAGVEDRARRAELDRAAAAAEAREQRKRRRVQLALAAAVGLLLLGGGAAGWWADRQAADRQREREVAAATARQAIVSALDQAEAALRADRLPEVDASLEVAERELPQADAPDLADRLAATMRDRAMLDRLRGISEQAGAIPFQGDSTGKRRKAILAGYAAAFDGYGLAIGQEPAERVRDTLRRSVIADALLVALDDWFFREPDRAGLRAVLAAADPDPFRSEVRAAVAARDEDRIRALAAKADGATLPPGFAAAFGSQPALYSGEDGLRLMKAAWLAHPDSYRLARQIGSSMLFVDFGAGGAEGQSRSNPFPELDGVASATLAEIIITLPTKKSAFVAEAVSWLRLAVALGPNRATDYFNLGYPWMYLPDDADLAECEAAVRRAIRLGLNTPLAHTTLGYILCRRKDFDRAEASFRTAATLAADYDPARLGMIWVLDGKGDWNGLVSALAQPPRQSDDEQHEGDSFVSHGFIAGVLSDIADGLVPKLVKAGRPGLAVRFYSTTLEKGVAFSKHWRLDPYDPACAAILASTGQGIDPPPPDERPAMRRKGLGWLNAALAREKQYQGRDTSRAEVHRMMNHWLTDSDLNSVRDEDELAKLPADEATEWRRLWAEVRALRDRTAPAVAPQPRPAKLVEP
ncbi:MAG: serine/threonine protein kinase [Gemmataceae bacterium]|nr:serine/threonine protein kinase [Gemmataceae bacterium]